MRELYRLNFLPGMEGALPEKHKLWAALDKLGRITAAWYDGANAAALMEYPSSSHVCPDVGEALRRRWVARTNAYIVYRLIESKIMFSLFANILMGRHDYPKS